MIDLFESYEGLPAEVRTILERQPADGYTYMELGALLIKMERLGYTFEYGLDAIPYGLRPT